MVNEHEKEKKRLAELESKKQELDKAEDSGNLDNESNILHPSLLKKKGD